MSGSLCNLITPALSFNVLTIELIVFVFELLVRRCIRGSLRGPFSGASAGHQVHVLLHLSPASAASWAMATLAAATVAAAVAAALHASVQVVQQRCTDGASRVGQACAVGIFHAR
jgi:hypothetical protein